MSLLRIEKVERPVDEPILMGIVNVTPDSFSDGGRFFDPRRAIEHGLQLVHEGADWLDIGGESTRPGAEAVSEEEELRRVLPVIEGLVVQAGCPISIDTYKANVARRAVQAGASIINDVTGFRDPDMIAVAANCDAACIVMHMRGTPTTMKDLAEYDDVIAELLRFFAEQFETLTKAGIDRKRIVLDPGIGFAKKRKHGLEIIRRLKELTDFDRPIMLGTSRKSMLGELTGRPELSRVHATIATTLAGYQRGARIFRVHDVAAMRDALAVWQAIEIGES